MGIEKEYPLEYERVNPDVEIHNSKPEFKFKNLSKETLGIKVKVLEK